MSTNLNDILTSAGIAPSPNEFMADDNSDRTLGCMNADDYVYHRSKAASWNEATYGVLPYERLEGVTRENILEKTKLDWSVEKTPLYTEYNNSKILVPKHFATVRSDTKTPLGVVGARYEIMQNSDLISIVEPFMDIDEICLESGGYFTDAKGERAGHRVYLQFKLPEYISIGDDKTEQMLFISNAHDGTSQILVGLTSIRTVCRNTFQMNINGATVKVRHTSSANERIQDVHKTLNVVNNFSKSLGAIFEKMADTKVGNKEINDMLTLVATGQEKPTELSTRARNAIGDMKNWVSREFKSATELNGNMYGLWNGLTAYYNHGVTTRGDRFSNIVNGGASKKMHFAFEAITDKLGMSLTTR